MTLTLHAWMIVPGLLTGIAVGALIWQACTTQVTADDIQPVGAIWAILMAVSLLSIWSAS